MSLKKKRNVTNRKSGAYEDWEIDFIRLAYPLSNASELSEILLRSKAGLHLTAKKLGLSNKGIKVAINSRFGMLKVHQRVLRNDKNMWECLCDCGNISYCTSGTLVSGHSRSCGCNRLKVIYKGGKYISGGWFKRIKNAAASRNLEFKLTIEYLDELFEKQEMKCSLTGMDLTISKKRDSKELYQETTASLDRINNDLGYIESNVQFLHKEINYMKYTHTQEYFIELCKKVVEYDKSSKCNNQ